MDSGSIVSQGSFDAGVENEQSTEDRPYLRVFGPEIGVIEYELSGKPVTIGRSNESDICLEDQRVSRNHARIVLQNTQYILGDVGSTGGTTVNRNKIQHHVLSHGDSAEIGPFVLQFRTHSRLPGATAAAKRAKQLLQSEFSSLPSGMQLEYRALESAPEEVFSSGDTLRIGQSGLLVPTNVSPGDCICVELKISWSGDRQRHYLGEIVGVIEEQGTHWMCVKLHTVSRRIREATVAEGNPGPWQCGILT